MIPINNEFKSQKSLFDEPQPKTSSDRMVKKEETRTTTVIGAAYPFWEVYGVF